MEQQPQKSLSWSEPAKSTTPASAPNFIQKPSQPVHQPQKNSQPPLQKNQNSTVRYASIAAAVIVIAVLGFWGLSHRSAQPDVTANVDKTSNNPSALTPTTSTIPTTPTQSLSGGLLVVSPQSAGLSVEIARAEVTEPTWVVVYESADGKPGNALGATLFFPQTQSSTVELLRTTLAGDTYFVGEQTDNGDKRFSLHGDQPVKDADGNLVLVSFKAQ